MEELKYYIYKNGYNVFELIDYELDFKNDIELINNLQNQSIIFIDRYCDNVDLLNYLKIYNSEKIKVILSDRTSNHNHFIENNFNDLKFYEFNLDMLTEREIEKIIEILFHIGIWGKYSNNKRVIKNKIIQEYYKLSLLLLDIFESEQIKKEIESLVKPFIKEKNLKETFFAILLLNLIDVEITKSLVEEVSGNDVIMNISFNELFGKDFKINSSLLSKFIISNYFTYSFIKEILLKIVEKAQDYKKYDVFWQKIERELLRFHFIEQIIPKEHKKIVLKQYFEKLKSKDKLQWLKNEPHYWLQYAMAEMANKNLQSAQQKLDTAYALKSSKYDFSYIDNQQARLYLLFALQENNGKKIFDYFQKANSLLTTKLDRYSVKHIATYKNLYKEKFRLFAKNDKRQFLDIVRNIYNDILKIKQDASDLYIMCNEYSKCENALRYILDKERLL
ncbi:hypothetical protein C6V80_09645 [Caminibacter pacificus]|uniref:Uncharacterized protein n=1 Tax=Caminibacter pacificus TaxID=1424653 RepID=A0ABX5VVF0_9BACT|nr:hypothetical protein [Caminibacter pacificus]QDD68102.1 hypothetical protein C6V80_09645 [Caminibacter pacificus]